MSMTYILIYVFIGFIADIKQCNVVKVYQLIFHKMFTAMDLIFRTRKPLTGKIFRKPILYFFVVSARLFRQWNKLEAKIEPDKNSHKQLPELDIANESFQAIH